MNQAQGDRSSIFSYSSYRDYLRDYTRAAKQSKATWSFSSWAKRLDVSKSTLVMIVRGKRHPGKEIAAKLAAHLGFSADEANYFYQLIETEKQSIDSTNRIEFVVDEDKRATVQTRQWLKLVLMEFSELTAFRDDAAWISERLHTSVGEKEIRQLMTSLTDQGLIEKTPSGRYQANRQKLLEVSETRLSREEIRGLHQDGQQAAMAAFEQASVKDRVFATSILRVPQSRVREAHQIISKMQEELSHLLEASHGDALYEMHLHFFPLTKNPVTS